MAAIVCTAVLLNVRLQLNRFLYLAYRKFAKYLPCNFCRWLFPFIGHVGICTTAGVIRDFAGPYLVAVCCLSDHIDVPGIIYFKIIVIIQQIQDTLCLHICWCHLLSIYILSPIMIYILTIDYYTDQNNIIVVVVLLLTIMDELYNVLDVGITHKQIEFTPSLSTY